MTTGYLASGGNPFVLRSDNALPDFGTDRSTVPVFPGTKATGKSGVEALRGSGSKGKSWYQKWTRKVLDHADLALAVHDSDVVLEIVLRAMDAAGLVQKAEIGKGQHAWGLAPDRLYVATEVAEVRSGAGRPLVVPRREAKLWQGVPSLDLPAPGAYDRREVARPTWFGRLYRDMQVRRIVAAEHTALLPRKEREHLEKRFATKGYRPWSPNVLSATPTLELGIDIGDLSTVMLCSVPPEPANYVQRTGRAGRRDGNAFNLSLAAGRPHDLYYYEQPLDMLAGKVEPPGVFLNATAVLERQMIAYCLDSWAASGVDERAVPKTMREVLANVERKRLSRFPYPFFDFVGEHARELAASFLAAFDKDLSDANKKALSKFVLGDVPDSNTAEAGADAEAVAGSRLHRRPLVHRLLDRFAEVARERKSIRPRGAGVAETRRGAEAGSAGRKHKGRDQGGRRRAARASRRFAQDQRPRDVQLPHGRGAGPQLRLPGEGRHAPLGDLAQDRQGRRKRRQGGPPVRPRGVRVRTAGGGRVERACPGEQILRRRAPGEDRPGGPGDVEAGAVAALSGLRLLRARGLGGRPHGVPSLRRVPVGRRGAAQGDASAAHGARHDARQEEPHRRRKRLAATEVLHSSPGGRLRSRRSQDSLCCCRDPIRLRVHPVGNLPGD